MEFLIASTEEFLSDNDAEIISSVSDKTATKDQETIVSRNNQRIIAAKCKWTEMSDDENDDNDDAATKNITEAKRESQLQDLFDSVAVQFGYQDPNSQILKPFKIVEAIEKPKALLSSNEKSVNLSIKSGIKNSATENVLKVTTTGQSKSLAQNPPKSRKDPDDAKNKQTKESGKVRIN